MSIFSGDFKTSPYWWDMTPRPSLKSKIIDRRLDVAIIGSGYTGLCAALTLSGPVVLLQFSMLKMLGGAAVPVMVVR